MTKEYEMIAGIIKENRSIALKDTNLTEEELIRLTYTEIAQEDDRLRLEDLKQEVSESIRKYRGLNMTDIQLRIERKTARRKVM